MKNNAVFKFIDSAISTVINPIVIILSLLITGMLTVGIASRIVIGDPIFGLEEIVLICVMWLYMLGATLAAKERTHLAADFVQVITKNRKIIHFMKLVASIISLIIAIFFATWSYDLVTWAIEKKQTTPVFHIPWYYSQGSLFCASIFFIIYLTRDVINDLTELFKNDSDANEEGDR